MAVQGKLQTEDRIMVWNKDGNMKCYLCKACMDSHDHLFLQCKFSKKVWEEMLKKSSVSGINGDWENIVTIMSSKCKSNAVANVVGRLILVATVYYIWQERNRRMFCGEERTENAVIESTSEAIKLRLMGLKVRKTEHVIREYEK
uniref:uncharacterized protein LOC122592233 n=1 Tax=Erigeron canadensis TaxID=72917 RepID=UPI001CB89520|nr:uncharacterized protein LOC122592233 [Erigeron canadensis]